jgi:hypothetical protein
MYLYIDITPRQGFNLMFSEPGQAKAFFGKKFFDWQNDRLLEAIEIFLKNKKKNINDIRGIAMSTSQSFTTVRITAVIINTIGAMLNIPVMMGGKSERRTMAGIIKMKKFKPIKPVYSRRPNISRPKKKLLPIN